MLAQYQVAAAYANQFRAHYLVGGTLFQDPILMNTGFVQKSILAHYGFVGLHFHPGETADQTAATVYLTVIYVDFLVIKSLAGVKGHYDFFQGGIAGSLANTVNGAFHLSGSIRDSGQGIGHRHTQVIVAVNADNSPVYIGNPLHY